MGWNGRRSASHADATRAPRSRTGAQSVLDAGAEIVGELRFADAVRIDGRVQGAIEAASRVVIGEHAHLEADIRAEEVEVHGTVEGDIRVRRKVVLHATARVRGEIETAGIAIEEGARFKGCIVIGADAAPDAGATGTAAPGPPREAGAHAATPDAAGSAARPQPPPAEERRDAAA